MGRFFGPRQARALTLTDAGVPDRSFGAPGSPASAEDAMRHSGVWAAIRLRANLISTLPVDVFTKRADGSQVEATKPRLFSRPAAGMLWHEWMYATQADLDRYGNTFGLIVARENGWPAQIELWAAREVTVITDGPGGPILRYRYRGKEYPAVDVWHERQYVAAGMPLGLSPIAYAAYSIGSYLSAQDFALQWFAAGAHPSGTLRHTELANIPGEILSAAKARFKAAVASRDLFVTGKEWEYSPSAVDANTAQFLAQMTYGIADVARWLDVPVISIDGAPNGSASLSYSNVTQDTLSLLIRHLGPAIARRELTLSANAMPQPRFLKLNSDALLRLDPTARTDLMVKQIDAWLLAPDEGRLLLNRPPLTPEQIAQLEARKTKPDTTPTGGTAA